VRMLGSNLKHCAFFS